MRIQSYFIVDEEAIRSLMDKLNLKKMFKVGLSAFYVYNPIFLNFNDRKLSKQLDFSSKFRCIMVT